MNRNLFFGQWIEKKSSIFKEENFIEQLAEYAPVFYEDYVTEVVPLEYKTEVDFSSKNLLNFSLLSQVQM